MADIDYNERRLEPVNSTEVCLLINLGRWYNPLRNWLRGKGMSQFSTQLYFDKYKVTAKPADWVRRQLRIFHLNLFPYFCGAVSR